MAKNLNVVNAPSNEEILKEMSVNPPVSKSTNEVADLLAGYKSEPIIDSPAAQDFEKKKRGRKPGQKAGMKKDDVPGSIDNGFGQETIPENPVITGALLVMLIDIALPNIIAFINNKVTKSKIKTTSLQLTSDELKTLEPLADQVAKEMSVKANPLTVLIITLIGFYGMKLMTEKTK